MKNLCVFLCAVLVVSSDLVAQSANNLIEITPLRESVHRMRVQGLNTVVLAGQDGLLVVDHHDDFVEETKAALAQFEQPVRFLINTNHHAVKTGGNGHYADAFVVAHDATRETMQHKEYRRPVPWGDSPRPESIWPGITFTDSLKLHLNGETITLFHIPAAANPGDAVVYFENARVLHIGDVYQRAKGSDVFRTAFGAFLERLPEDVIVVNGHGRGASGQLSKEQLRTYHRVLGEMQTVVRRRIQNGQDWEGIEGEPLFEDWAATWRVRPRMPIQLRQVYVAEKWGALRLPTTNDFMRTIDEEGVAAGVALFEQVKTEQSDYAPFFLDDRIVTDLSLYFIQEDRLDDAEALIHLNTEVYPESAFTQYVLGVLFQARGDKTKARHHLEEAIRLLPTDPLATNHVRRTIEQDGQARLDTL